jgi:hypothetical protein
MVKYIFLWFILVFAAIVNGAIRNLVYTKFVGELSAHQISVVTGIILFGIIFWLIFRKWMPVSSQQAIMIGVMWLIMTVAFEFIFGHFVMGNSWDKLFHDYNILKGRLWIIVLLWVTFAPYIFYKVLSGK